MSESKDPTQKPKKSASISNKASQGFTNIERAAMKERAKELRVAAKKEDGEKAFLAKIAEMSEPDRSMAKRIHEIVKANAPNLSPRTWYGMPAYAKGDKVVCFFQSAQKFGSRYSTFGFTDSAYLDEGDLWPVAFAITELTAEVEATIATLIQKAVS